MVRLKTFSGLLLLSVFTSCSTTGAFLFPEMPPRASIKSNSTIAVDFFSGFQGERVASEIEKNLLTKGFKVVDRKRLISQFQEKIISPTNYKTVPAQILISGHVNDYRFSKYTESESVSCSSPEKGDYAGTRYRLQGVGNVSATVRVIDLKTSKVIYTDTLTARERMENTRHTCSNFDYGVTHPDSQEVMEGALTRFSVKFNEIIAPYTAMIHVDLMKFDDELLPELAEGHSWMQKSEFKKASSSYKRALNRAKKHNLPKEAIGHSMFAYGLSLSYQRDPKGLKMIDDAYKIHKEDTYLNERIKAVNFMNLQQEY